MFIGEKSSFDHETNIYRPQDRGKEKNAPNFSADDTMYNGTQVDNSAKKDRQTEQEVIKALACLKMNELSYLSTC
jgi:hypothetical protein